MSGIMLPKAVRSDAIQASPGKNANKKVLRVTMSGGVLGHGMVG
jgi:hypothetical protein